MASAGDREGSSSKQAGGDDALSRAMQNLELREGELDDVFIGEEDLKDLQKQSRWLAVAKINTVKPVSPEEASRFSRAWHCHIIL